VRGECGNTLEEGAELWDHRSAGFWFAARTLLEKTVKYPPAFYTVEYLYKANAIAAVTVLEETKGRRGC